MWRSPVARLLWEPATRAHLSQSPWIWPCSRPRGVDFAAGVRTPSASILAHLLAQLGPGLGVDVKRRHHFVPQFYLRGFASLPRRINLLHLEGSILIRHASLRDQCYRHRLYGKQDDVEDAFSEIEGRAAAVVSSIVSSRQPPVRPSSSYSTLVEFAALQLLRTTAAMEQMRRASGDLANAVFDGSPPIGFPLDDDEELAQSVQMLPEMAE